MHSPEIIDQSKEAKKDKYGSAVMQLFKKNKQFIVQKKVFEKKPMKPQALKDFEQMKINQSIDNSLGLNKLKMLELEMDRSRYANSENRIGQVKSTYKNKFSSILKKSTQSP